MRKSQIRHLEQILAQKRYGTFFLGHPVYGLYALKHHIVEMRRNVTDAGQTNN